MKNPLLSIFVYGSFFVFGSTAAMACSCVDLGNPINEKVSWWLKDSAVVFSGEAIKLEKVSETVDVLATFSVSEFWKGDLSSAIEVRTLISGGSCGYDFRIGNHYLVYAWRAKGQLMTGACWGNSRLFERFGKEQLEVLGKGKTPGKKVSSSLQDTNDQ